MSGITINKILVALILIVTLLHAQEGAKKIYDETKEQTILFGKINVTDFNDSLCTAWYNPGFAEYKIDSLTVDNFAQLLKNTEITIVMGTWCEDSHREVPRFIKIIEYAGYNPEHINIYAVNGFKEAGIENFNEYDIKFVPTFIFYRDGEEIGRIIEAPAETLEEDIANILFGNNE